MHLSGELADWSLKDMLQIMHVTQKTGSLDIEGEHRGRIHFRDGTVTGAELVGRKDTDVGNHRSEVADILFVLSTLDNGSFSVGAADGPDTPGWSIEEILADVDALRSLEGEVADAGLFEAGAIRVGNEIEEPINISPDDWAVLVSLIRPFTFDNLEARVGPGSAVRTLHTLHRLGVAEATSELDDESDWLDRVADNAAPLSDDPIWLEEVPRERESQIQPNEPLAAAPEEDPVVAPAEDPVVAPAEEPLVEAADDSAPKPAPNVRKPTDVPGVSAPASTTLTDGVYAEIRRLRSKVADK